MAITDGYSQDLLKNINPQNVRLYLLSRNWKQEKSTNYYDIFSSPIDGSVVTVPNSRDYSDYVRRMSELINTVSDSEKITIQHVVAGLTMSTATDTIEYHYEPYSGEIGLIPIPEMAKIIDAGNNLNIYGYRDVTEFRPYYRNTNWKGKKDLDAIRIGPTLAGSYIVQFIYPTLNNSQVIHPSLFNEICPDNEALYKTCNKVESSLRTIVEAAELGKTEIESEFKISHNFICSTLELCFENADVEIRRKRTFENKEPVKPINLTKKISSRISKIEENMRPSEMLNEHDFVGKIFNMSDPRAFSINNRGKVKIRYIDDEGKARSLSFVLTDDQDLNDAHDAFKHQKNIVVSGKLVGPNNSRRLEDIVEFKVL